MLVPIFAHGKMENVQKAIDTGNVKYPAYIWIADLGQYGFLNKNNELEIIGIPQLTGTIDNVVILSSLTDGLYQIRGQYKITQDYVTTFNCDSYALVIVQTVDDIKKIRRITADDLTTYNIEEDLSVTSDEIVTKEYLDEFVNSKTRELTEAQYDALVNDINEVKLRLDGIKDEVLSYVSNDIINGGS